MKLKVQNASYGYKEDELLYDDVHLEVCSGEILSILGPNGSGKTTLLKCIMNFLYFRTGYASIDDMRICDYRPKDLWKIISYVPQAKGVATQLNVLEMVTLGRIPFVEAFRQPQKKDYAIARQALDELNIYHLMDKQCHEISGGELQMVLLARALVSEPKILILDEPESNLDFKNQLTILKHIKNLAQQKDMICLINTHYPEHARKISDKLLLINKQKKKTIFGQSSEIFSEKNLKEIFDVDVIVDTLNRHDKEHHIVIPLFDEA
ncbi:MAG: ABC transporter ATP-binding protein [Alphaproteobacteria bacterium]